MLLYYLRKYNRASDVNCPHHTHSYILPVRSRRLSVRERGPKPTSYPVYEYVLLHRSKVISLTVPDSSFHYCIRRSPHSVWPFRTFPDFRSSSHNHWGWFTLHFRCRIPIISMDRLPSSCRRRTRYLFPDPNHGWTSTCSSRGCRDSDSNTHV